MTDRECDWTYWTWRTLRCRLTSSSASMRCGPSPSRDQIESPRLAQRRRLQQIASVSMNRYAEMAQAHWSRWLPDRYAALEDPREFFSTLGEQAAARIEELTDQLAGPDSPGETYMGKVGRINNARTRAEEIVLTELILLRPEPEVLDAEEAIEEAALEAEMGSDISQASAIRQQSLLEEYQQELDDRR